MRSPSCLSKTFGANDVAPSNGPDVWSVLSCTSCAPLKPRSVNNCSRSESFLDKIQIGLVMIPQERMWGRLPVGIDGLWR